METGIAIRDKRSAEMGHEAEQSEPFAGGNSSVLFIRLSVAFPKSRTHDEQWTMVLTGAVPETPGVGAGRL